jgi:hypothetical protein
VNDSKISILGGWSCAQTQQIDQSGGEGVIKMRGEVIQNGGDIVKVGITKLGIHFQASRIP